MLFSALKRYMTCHAIYWQKARTKSKDIDGSDRLTGGCVCQRIKSEYSKWRINSETLKYIEVLCKYFVNESLRLWRRSKSSSCNSIKSFHDISLSVYSFNLFQNTYVSIFRAMLQISYHDCPIKVNMIWSLRHWNFLNVPHGAICLNGLDLSDEKSRL
jgi:hypothetical protein